MRIVFMGTPQFAVPALDILVSNNFNVVAVVTASDSFGGRGGKQLLESAVKKYAVQHNIPVLQPSNLKSASFLAALQSYQADVQIVVAFRMLPEVVWNMPKYGTFNLHGSLLPKYRGAAPINHAIINGDKETGVTSFKLKHEIDTGDVLIRRKIKICDDDTAGSLHDKMMVLGAEVILETVQKISSQDLTFLPQNEIEATSAPKIFHPTCQINFQQSSLAVYNFIRGLSPYPCAWCKIDDKEVKILKATYETCIDVNLVGNIYTDGKKVLKVKCADGYISIISIKPEGKKEMTISEFLNGYKIVNTTISFQ